MSSKTNISEFYFVSSDDSSENFHKSVIDLNEDSNFKQYSINISFKNNFHYAQNILNEIVFNLIDDTETINDNYFVTSSNTYSISSEEYDLRVSEKQNKFNNMENNTKTPLNHDIESRKLQTNYNNRSSNYHALIPWSKDDSLDKVKKAVHQLSLRSKKSTSSCSSMDSESVISHNNRSDLDQNLHRHSSIETVDSNFTNASDEFVWINSNHRIIELQNIPWDNANIISVIGNGKCKPYIGQISSDIACRLSYYLQKVLFRISIEIRRFSSVLNMCSKHDVLSAFNIILSSSLAESCRKACLRAATMFAVSGDSFSRASKTVRAGLNFSVGKFHTWMIHFQSTAFVHEISAIYLCAAMENILEEIFLKCISKESNSKLTISKIDEILSKDTDFKSVLQLDNNLIAGNRNVTKWASNYSISSGKDSGRGSSLINESALLTNFLPSTHKIDELVNYIEPKRRCTFLALKYMNYFIRCTPNNLTSLNEWFRISQAFSSHRFDSVIDHNDILQTARILLPVYQTPVRNPYEELSFEANLTNNNNYMQQIHIEMAFKLIFSGQIDLLKQSLNFLPFATRFNSYNYYGLTPLMVAVIRNDTFVLKSLIEFGAWVNQQTLSKYTETSPCINCETHSWTGLTFAAAFGHLKCAKLLLDSGANVEGGFRVNEDIICTFTPLQIAVAIGDIDMVLLLLERGAQPFISTYTRDNLRYLDSVNRGCYSAICVAAVHGRLEIFRKLLTHRAKSSEVLSIEDILAESISFRESICQTSVQLEFNKSQIKTLQDAMYQSAENGFLELTLEIRSLQIPWTIHCWMQTLKSANESHLDHIIDILLQDCMQILPEEFSSQFVNECLPLLFHIFQKNKKEETILLLADILSTCYGLEPIEPICSNELQNQKNESRIDPKFVNNPELSDVVFRVENRLFYAHKIVLITSSPRLKSILSTSSYTKSQYDSSLPHIIEINDIRYEIFQIVIQYVYQGGCTDLMVPNNLKDLLELLAAANFFQLDNLILFCEHRCSIMINLDNIVTIYIHAKVYNTTRLLEYCQAFILQNMVHLLKYDDSVKRLLFCKKVPNHDVLSNLFGTLKKRINTRKLKQTAQSRSTVLNNKCN